MESFQILKSQAEEKLKIADHLISTTYSLVKEPKLLVSVIENIYQALDLAMNALLVYEKNFQSIPSYSNTFEERLEVFKRKIVTKHNISNDIVNFIIEVKHTLDEHKKSSVEFIRKEKFVISDNEYNLHTLSIDDVKKTFSKAKHYTDILFKIIKYE